jgi:hypothetical protein
MLSSHFQPIEIDGHKFDKGSILYEFDAHREPERTQFPQIGAWVKSRIPMNEIPTPQMYWQGRCWPDLYIANQLDAAASYWDYPVHEIPIVAYTDKSNWRDDITIESVSLYLHGKVFHDTFIEPMCRKIAGRPSSEIAAKHHRAIWLPLYWPKTLRTRQSIPTPFWYPKAGYAGAISCDGTPGTARNDSGNKHSQFDSAEISITFVLAKPRTPFSVLFVVDESPIYRITDMDVCAGIDCEWHRWVVESRGTEWDEIALPWADGPIIHYGHNKINLPLPTIANVQAGWKPRPHMNAQLLEVMQNELSGR